MWRAKSLVAYLSALQLVRVGAVSTVELGPDGSVCPPDPTVYVQLAFFGTGSPSLITVPAPKTSSTIGTGSSSGSISVSTSGSSPSSGVYSSTGTFSGFTSTTTSLGSSAASTSTNPFSITTISTITTSTISGTSTITSTSTGTPTSTVTYTPVPPPNTTPAPAVVVSSSTDANGQVVTSTVTEPRLFMGQDFPTGTVIAIPEESPVLLGFAFPGVGGARRRQTSSPGVVIQGFAKGPNQDDAPINSCSYASRYHLDGGMLVDQDGNIVGKNNTDVSASITPSPYFNDLVTGFLFNNGILSWNVDGLGPATFYSCGGHIYAGFPYPPLSNCAAIIIGGVRATACPVDLSDEIPPVSVSTSVVVSFSTPSTTASNVPNSSSSSFGSSVTFTTSSVAVSTGSMTTATTLSSSSASNPTLGSTSATSVSNGSVGISISISGGVSGGVSGTTSSTTVNVSSSGVSTTLASTSSAGVSVGVSGGVSGGAGGTTSSTTVSVSGLASTTTLASTSSSGASIGISGGVSGGVSIGSTTASSSTRTGVTTTIGTSSIPSTSTVVGGSSTTSSIAAGTSSTTPGVVLTSSTTTTPQSTTAITSAITSSATTTMMTMTTTTNTVSGTTSLFVVTNSAAVTYNGAIAATVPPATEAYCPTPYDLMVIQNNLLVKNFYQILCDADIGGTDAGYPPGYPASSATSMSSCLNICNAWNSMRDGYCQAVVFVGGVCYPKTNIYKQINIPVGRGTQYNYFSSGAIAAQLLDQTYPLPTNSKALLAGATTTPGSTTPVVVIPTTTPAIVSTTTPVILPTTTPVIVPTTTPVVIPTTTPAVVPTTTPVIVPTTTPAVVPTTTPAVVPTTTPAIVPTTTPAIIVQTTTTGYVVTNPAAVGFVAQATAPVAGGYANLDTKVVAAKYGSGAYNGYQVMLNANIGGTDITGDPPGYVTGGLTGFDECLQKCSAWSVYMGNGYCEAVVYLSGGCYPHSNIYKQVNVPVGRGTQWAYYDAIRTAAQLLRQDYPLPTETKPLSYIGAKRTAAPMS